MYTGTMVGYAQKKVSDHVHRLFKIYEDFKNGTLDESWIREIEYRDNIFPEIDYNMYKTSWL
jgi:glycosyl hydrolase, family 57